MKKTKTDFSKKLALSVSFLFFFTIFFSLVTWFWQNRIPSEILTFVATPFSIVISGYFAKAGVENYQKIKNNYDDGGI